MLKIKEIIVVEGKDDQTKVLQALEADVVTTGGSHFTPGILKTLDHAYEKRGLVIFTDPDYTGLKIRRRLAARYPLAKHAYLNRAQTTKKGDIGIENASYEDIRLALMKARVNYQNQEEIWTMNDLLQCGLVGAQSSSKRYHVCQKLNIHAGNGKQLLKQFNALQISKEQVRDVLKHE